MKSAVQHALVVVISFLVVGALAGVAWYFWWAPAPETNTYLLNGGRPFFEHDVEFRGTGLYLAIALPVGLLLGALFAWRFDRDEVVTLVAVVIGAVLGGLVMAWIGHALGPDAPASVDLKGDYPDGFPSVTGDLTSEPIAWFLGLPGGALVGCVLVFLGVAGRLPAPRADPHAHDVAAPGLAPDAAVHPAG